MDGTMQNTTVRMFSNQKPKVDKNICNALRSHTTTYNMGLATGDMHSYKAASYNIRKKVAETKQHYGGPSK